MPAKLNIVLTDKVRARRHVLSQQLHRLRKHYRFLMESGITTGAGVTLDIIRVKERKYVALGGKPHHRGNVL